MRAITLDKYYWFFSSLIVLFCCFFLFWFDHETGTFADLVTPGNLVALVIYFTLTFLLCGFLFYLFSKITSKRSFALAHLIGIPAGFILVILLLSWSMGRL
ncbi:MAG TPA: hypothetical protein VKB95_16495 [Chitinophagaceae bacterium]|nr:hypothetical protein [Chitinophagaceae bacterium]